MASHPFPGLLPNEINYPPSSVNNLSPLNSPMTSNRERNGNNAFDTLDFGTTTVSSCHSNPCFSSSALVSNQPEVNNKPAINTFNGHLIPNSNYSNISNSCRNQRDAPLSPDDRFRHNSQSSMNSVQPNPIYISCDQVSKQSSEMPQTDNWCTIAYHELSSRIGEMFHVKRKDKRVVIDGFTEPSLKNNRFSLGVLNNINRSQVTRSVRQHIGKGIEVSWVNNVVMLKCVSENPVFVQSPNSNQKHGWNIATVVKVPKGCCLAIFDMDVFAKTLADEVKKGFEEVFALSKMCTVRISFVKGWGREYRRQSIMNTPCWIEIRLNGPLKWIDIVLNEIEGPKQVIGSCS